MFDKLNPKWQAFIARRHKQSIITVNNSKERTDFFNFLIKSRNIPDTNQAEMVSTLIQAITEAATISLDNIQEEMLWYQSIEPMDYAFGNSPLTLTNNTAGFEYGNLD